MQPYLIASPDHVICLFDSFKLGLVQLSYFTSLELFSDLTTYYLFDNVSSVENIIILSHLFVVYYNIIIFGIMTT